MSFRVQINKSDFAILNTLHSITQIYTTLDKQDMETMQNIIIPYINENGDDTFVGLNIFDVIKNNNNLQKLVIPSFNIIDIKNNNNINKIILPPNLEYLDMSSFHFSDTITDKIILPDKLKHIVICSIDQLKYLSFPDIDTDYILKIANDMSDDNIEHNNETLNTQFGNKLKILNILNNQSREICFTVPDSVHTLYCNSYTLQSAMTHNIRHLYLNATGSLNYIFNKIQISSYMDLKDIHLITKVKFQYNYDQIKLPYGCTIDSVNIDSIDDLKNDYYND